MICNKDVAIRDIYNENVHEDCLSCGEDITHPLCPDCIGRGFFEWCKNYPEEKKLKTQVYQFLKGHNLIKGKYKTCVSCNKANTKICPYCFTDYLYSNVKKSGMGVKVMSEFLFMFNFDFTHKGYYRELEAYGSY